MSFDYASEDRRPWREPFEDEAETLANYKELAVMYWDFVKFFAKWGYLSVLKVILRIVESRVRARARRRSLN